MKTLSVVLYMKGFKHRDFQKKAVQKTANLLEALSSTFAIRLFESIMFAMLRSYLTSSFHSKIPV